MSGRDADRERELLDRINNVEIHGHPIRDLLVGNILVWQQFQQSILYADIPNFLAAGSYEKYLESAKPSHSLRIFLLQLLALCISAVAALRIILAKPPVLIFSIDKVSDPRSRSDFRMAAVYAAVAEERVPFIECFHTQIGRPFLKSFLARRRSAIYLESLDVLWQLRFIHRRRAAREPLVLSSIVGTPDEQAFMRHLITRYVQSLPRHAFRARALGRLFSIGRPHVAFLVDDTRHYHDVVQALTSVGTPSYAIQHGHFTKHDVGWQAFSGEHAGFYVRPDAILVWSSYWKEQLEKINPLFPESSILIGGNPTAFAAIPRMKDVPLRILVPFETYAPFDLMRALIERMRKAGMEIVFKPRPDRAAPEQAALYGLPADTPKINDINTLTLPISLAMGTYSTILYDLVARGTPVALLKTPSTFSYSLADDELATLVDPTSPDFEKQLIEIAALPDAVCNARSRRLASDQPLATTITQLLRNHARHR